MRHTVGDGRSYDEPLDGLGSFDEKVDEKFAVSCGIRLCEALAHYNLEISIVAKSHLLLFSGSEFYPHNYADKTRNYGGLEASRRRILH